MQREDAINPEVLALSPVSGNGSLGEKLLLERAAGYTTLQLAMTYGVEEATINQLIQVAIDDRILSEIRQEVRDHLIVKTFELDQELKQMYERLPDFGVRTTQTAVRLIGGIVPAEDGRGVERIADRTEVVTLEETWSNVPSKIGLLKERRQLVQTQNVLLKSDTNDRGGERGDDMKRILGTIGAIAQQVFAAQPGRQIQAADPDEDESAGTPVRTQNAPGERDGGAAAELEFDQQGGEDDGGE